MSEPAHAELIRSVAGLVSECGAMGGGIWSRNVYRRRQTKREDGKRQTETDRIRMTDRDTGMKLEAEIAGEEAGRCK